MEGRELRGLVEGASARLTDFCQRLVMAASLSGHEEQVAELVSRELGALGCNEVRLDQAGNVIARLAGGPGRSLLLHAHMDIVDPGDVSRWRHPPFAGEVADGFVWGRGACDTKGSLAAQVYALGLLAQAGISPPGDVYLAGVVCEETGGAGTVHLARTVRPDIAVIGEPSSNTLRRGHRGRVEFVITWQGRSAHASAPERGLNPHFAMARFLLALRQTPLKRDPTFGGTSVAPTLAYVDQTSSNVIPSEITLHLDWRNAPGEPPAAARALIEQLLQETTEPGIQARIDVRERQVRTYTGLEQTLSHVMPAFCLPVDSPWVVSSSAILEAALGRKVPLGVWTFATDGGNLSEVGVPCIGFGPGDESLAHVVDERLAIDQLLEATVGYMALALKLGAV